MKYNNELCKLKKTISGYATCHVGYRAVEVLKNENGTAIKMNIMAANFCECKIHV